MTADIYDPVLNLMARAEHGLQHAHDAQILFEALKSAATAHSTPSDMLKFLKFHIAAGREHVRNLPAEH